MLAETDATYYEIADQFQVGYQTVVHINSGFHFDSVMPDAARPIRRRRAA